jgi:hypothetical protein
MPLDTNFNVNPYYDDFDEDKKFLRTLFKPGYAVQARELTQIQTQLQNQIERFGKHIFKNGSLVLGGQSNLQDATYLKLQSTYDGDTVSYLSFVNKTILSADETKRGEVIASLDVLGDAPITLMVKQIYGAPFASGDVIKTDESATQYATVDVDGVGTGQLFSMQEGVFFYEGYFIKNLAQTVATARYSNTTANARIGFEITESNVTAKTDTSLLDPAQDASNYQAPGADRFKVDLVLATRDLDSTDDTQFIEMARVENGILTKVVKYPVYSAIEDTLARRTYDESGNYTVRPFEIALEDNSSNTAQTSVILSPGKAYVFGYEFETTGPTRINVDKPRTSIAVENKRLTADYGNFVYTTNHRGSIPIDTMTTVSLHCVPNSAINLTSAATVTNTKIGTARVKTIAYESTSDSANTLTNVYRTYLFDINVGSLTANVVSATSTTITLPTLYSSVTDAYTGSKVRITTGPGSLESTKFITAYNGATRVATVDTAFTTTPLANSVFSIDFEFNDVESIAQHSGNTPIAGANIDVRSKDNATPYVDAFLVDTQLEPQIFELGQEFIANSSINLSSYSYKRLFKNQSFAANQVSITTGTGESISSAATESSKNENYKIIVTNRRSSTTYANGQIVPASSISVDSGASTITVVGALDMLANVVATIDVSNPAKKVKTYTVANTVLQTPSSPDHINVFGNSAVNVYSSNCQTHIAQSFVVKTPGVNQSLFVSDVYAINTVLDYRGTTVDEANTASAVNITARYVLDNGQRDSFYDHAAIKLKPGVLPPTGPLVVRFDRFISPSEGGFFSVDSYVEGGLAYGDIPKFVSPTTGKDYVLRDALDFRPVRADGTTTVTFDATNNSKLPENGSDIIIDYSYYLPRIDKVILNKNRTFEVIKGIPSLTPTEPADKSESMTMFVLTCPAYVADTGKIQVKSFDHRRYTMRDIGAIEKRVENLEYYTSLSMLEQSTFNKQDLTILDTQNLPRFKNGIVVDAFDGHSIADVFNEDYSAAIDPINKNMRPTFNISSQGLVYQGTPSTNVQQHGPLLTLSSVDTVLIDQPLASKAINVNPFNVISFLGKITLDPASDIWIDVERKPDVLVNIGGDQDAWSRLINQSGAGNYQYEWGSWDTKWTGTSTSVSTEFEQTFAFGIPRRILERTTTTATGTATRQGIASRVVTSNITKSIGDRIVDVSVIPYMRDNVVLFSGSDFKPDTVLYPFFDNLSVKPYVARANKFKLSGNNLNFQTTTGNSERVNIRDMSAATINGSALIVKTSNTEAYVVSVNANTTFNIASANLIGTVSGSSYKILAYEHYTGTATAATANTVTLATHAIDANNIGTYVGSTISIVRGTGAGQTRTISAYNVVTRTATVSANFSPTPSTDSVYSIGDLTTTRAGDIAGLYFIPTGVFRTGEKSFKLIDTSSGDVGGSSTNGDATFFAQGLIQQKETTIVSAIVPTIQRNSTSETVPVSGTSQTTTRVSGYWDPLAQTFLVDPINSSQGVYLSKVRVCFKTKDTTIPVTLQVRPTVNGYPSSSVIYPLASVTLTPDKVKTTLVPSLDDSSKYTEFAFEAPIFLQPGEHSFVILANSKNYEMFVGEIGKTDLVSSRQISDQPYGGSLFLSQNGSTWTADQSTDMAFRLYYKDFTRGTGTAYFNIAAPASNTVFDLVQMIAGEVQVANTSIVYEFDSTIDATGAKTGYQEIIPGFDLDLNDAAGRRVLTTANTCFNVKVTMASTNPRISPQLDMSRFGIIAVENRINNLGLSNTDVIVTNGGDSYEGMDNVAITITGGGGSGAEAVANVTSNGVIDRIYITNAGSGYQTSPTITISTLTANGANATAIVNGEDSASGGNSLVRYVTRRVTLNDGFDSGDLRVYLTAYKPSQANIRVYYKILSQSDPDTFDEKNYQLMTELGNQNFVSLSKSDFRELVFAPGSNGVADNAVNYTSNGSAFNTFKTFAIKIVLTGTNPTDVPKVRDFRAIALPSGS